MEKRQFIRHSLLGICGVCAARWVLGDESVDLTGVLGSSGPADWDRWTRKVGFWTMTAKGLKCQLCPSACIIKLNEAGECKTHINIKNELYTISYGNPCAVHVDPIEKKPLYHFLPQTKAFSIATAGCNLACLNCQNWEISQVSPKTTRNIDLPPSKVVEQAIANNCDSIAYTYSDPVAFYDYTLDTAKLARAKGVKNLLHSAGYINPLPLKELAKYIDAANIDLKSFSNETYEMLTGGTLQPVLDSLKILLENQVWLEITHLVIPDWTDDMNEIKEMCKWLNSNGFQNTPLHFSRFHPLHKLTNLPPTPVETLDKARKTAMDAGLKYVYIGNVPGSAAQNTYCPNCKKLLVERKGFQITQNLLKKSACPFCNNRIPGYWS